MKIIFYKTCLPPGNGLSCKEKQAIVDYHNQLRQSVALGQVQGQPAASMMMHLVNSNVILQRSKYFLYIYIILLRYIISCIYYFYFLNNNRLINITITIFNFTF